MRPVLPRGLYVGLPVASCPATLFSSQVQQQTLDVAVMLHRVAPLAHYYMTFEDDLETCSHALAAIQYAISKVGHQHHVGGRAPTPPLSQFCHHAHLFAVLCCGTQADQRFPNWLSIRVSFGMMGVILRSTDALVLSDYLIEHVKRRPPDHLMIEWFCGETEQSGAYKAGRQHVTFRWVGWVFVCAA
jgi:hypothetical protein